MGSTERQRAVPRFFIVTLSLCFFGSSQAAPVPAAPVPAGDNKTPSVGAGPTQMSAAPRQLETISVTGVAIPGNPLSQAANVDVVDADAMQADGVSNLGEGLDQLAGVNAIGTGNVSGKPVIRGLSGLRVKILSDDVGIASQAFGVRHMPVIDPFLLDRAEVVRGASRRR